MLCGIRYSNLSNKAKLFGTVESLDSVEKELKVFKSKTELIIDEYGTRNYEDLKDNLIRIKSTIIRVKD